MCVCVSVCEVKGQKEGSTKTIYTEKKWGKGLSGSTARKLDQ